jgi:hypothetical protein
MHQVGGELGQRDQHEPSQMHPGVGNLQIRFRHDLRAVEEQVQVHDPRRSPLREARTATCLLHLHKRLQQFLGTEGGLYLDDAIEKPAPRHILRFRLIEG